MKLEYLSDAAKNLRLIRLYDYTETEVPKLRTITTELSIGLCEKISLEREGWMAPIGGCKLTLQCGERDFGICQLGPRDLACVLDAGGWKNVEGLLAPFCNSATTGFQWLVNRGEIALLISRSGQW